MSRVRLRQSDMVLLGRLYGAPLELGVLPADSVERLSSYGLVRTVLGSCEITRRGQLALHRENYHTARRKRVLNRIASWSSLAPYRRPPGLKRR